MGLNSGSISLILGETDSKSSLISAVALVSLALII
ncbi:hypothetical protein EPIR_2268 [Erwinia piriflorinigrans CFBP 5888]|uniref:Uncharacterized protein n=1 Tax=Erwinia piriflorinigrans CFBP 5888 TaxID=1161919 RepID=V5Z9K2_9GAMM|nr:hypothetical protein EPIR_2268 [Erwinia piriflorinigrans CFBP 5888]